MNEAILAALANLDLAQNAIGDDIESSLFYVHTEVEKRIATELSKTAVALAGSTADEHTAATIVGFSLQNLSADLPALMFLRETLGTKAAAIARVGALHASLVAARADHAAEVQKYNNALASARAALELAETEALQSSKVAAARAKLELIQAQEASGLE